MNKTKTLTLFIIALFLFSSISYYVFAAPSETTSNSGGFNNALLKTNSNAETQVMEARMLKIQTQSRTRLETMTQLQFQLRDGDMIASDKSEAKLFGFINTQKTFEYKIADEGTVTRNRRFFDFMFSGVDPVILVEI